MSNDQPGWPPPPSPEPPAGQAPSTPPAYGQPYGQQPYAASPYAATVDPNRRPGGVTAAAVTTLVLSGLSAVVYVLLLVAMLTSKEAFLDGMSDELNSAGDNPLGEVDRETLFAVVSIATSAFLIWCLVACVLAVLVLRRSNVARILLVVSSGMAALICLLAIATVIPIVTLVGSIAVIVLLFTGGANQWFAGKGQSGTPAQPVF